MDINGGLLMYFDDYDRLSNEPSPEGRKVRFLNKNGYSIQREDALKHFNEGDILTVQEILVDRNSSEVEFKEVPNERFNTVMFEDVEEDV